MKKKILKITGNILLVLLLSLFLLSVIWFCYGSLEEFPTEEQQEKVRIVAGGLMVVSGIPSAVFIGVKLFRGAGKRQE